MKVKFYVNWDDQTLLSEAEYAERIKEASEDMKDEDDAFADFLATNYSSTEIFDFEDEDRARVRKEFYEECERMAKEDLSYMFDEIEKEI